LLGARCPAPGQTSFVSSEPGASHLYGYYPTPYVAFDSDVAAVAAPARSVVEGDLFRVLSPGLLLNLNAYRGLQVIDLGDVTQPRIAGRLPLAGRPIEMYVVGKVAIVLLGGVQAALPILPTRYPYWSAETSRILAVDLSVPAQPALLDEIDLPGTIQTSRVTQEGDRAALYVVASEWDVGGSSRATVASFDLAGGGLAPVDRIELDGPLAAAQATPEMLMVARHDWNDGGSRIGLVDIRDPGGLMTQGGDVYAAGMVQKQFDMDYQRGVVRVVSTDFASATNHLETFEASDPSSPLPLDAVSFGQGESLFATLFLGDRAFAVTYLRVDPFHAFAIGEDGVITPGAEFVVSGWNDFFRAVYDDSRLIGVGTDDAGGTRTLAVSLYDVSDIHDPTPLLARERIDLAFSGSEASWDHRAFSVIEGAVSVPGPGGADETGLVLLPYTGWDAAAQQSLSGVQIFTFSETTLTRRGAMPHGSPVRRSFATDADVVANVSEDALALFDTADPGQPAPLGAAELAPDYSDVLRFGDYRARVVQRGYGAQPTAVEIVPATEDPDVAGAVARFELAPGAAVHQVGSLLVGIAFDFAASASGATESEITVHDLSDPTDPRRVGQLRSDRIEPGYGYAYRTGLAGVAMLDCLSCILPWRGGSSSVAAIPGGLAFLQGRGDRGWTLDVLDLGDPSAPGFAAPVALGDGLEGLTLLAKGSELWIAAKHHLGTGPRGRSSARYYAVRVDASQPSAPSMQEPINVPGELVAVDGDRIFTRDHHWSSDSVETAVVRLVLEPPLARVEAVRWFADSSVQEIALDGAGNLLALRTPYSPWIGAPVPIVADQPLRSAAQILSVLDADSADLEVSSDTELPSWSALLGAVPGRAILAGGQSLLVFALDDPSAPVARSFASRSWIDRIRVDGRSALHAGGRYGIQVFDLDAQP
jgi:hypothetical protein